MKICGECGIRKESANFCKDKTRKDNLCPQCKVCREAYQKTYTQTTSGKIRRNTAGKRYCQNHPEKKSAKNAVHLAIKNGIIRRSVFCESCGLPAKTEAHHFDYNKPLKVEWLCRTCHIKIHV